MKKYDYKDACFACTTPYQVIGAISITICNQLDADLYIFGMFPNYNIIAEKIKKYNYFSNVHTIDCSKIVAASRLEGFWQMLFAESTVNKYLPKKVAYHSYYSSSRALPKTILQHVLLKRNSDMNHVIYEDGMGTYIKNSHPLNVTKLKSIAERILGWNLDDPNKISIMAYIPELVEVPEYLKGHTVEQMPRLNFNKKIIDMFEDVFNINQSDHIKEKYIIFDTLRLKDDKKFKTLDKCYEIIAECVGISNVINKPHPRSRVSNNSNISVYQNQEIPMEILYANMSDLDQKVLISFTSSAVFTPKILFNKEPQVISLHRIFKESTMSMLFEEVYKKFKETYTDMDKVSAPESIKELKETISRL